MLQIKKSVLPRPRFIQRSDVVKRLEGKTVAIVGSGPSVLTNPQGFIDSHDVVVRVNNYKLMTGTGKRTDVFYSFFGSSIKKTQAELVRDGVSLCMCKCPNAQAIESQWHRQNGKMHGVDFRWIYQNRARWWFCDTYVPTVKEFSEWFQLLGGHVPTTGFSAILDVLACNPKSVYLTGFDFFRTKVHNVTQKWRPKHLDDPIRHEPERELQWLVKNIDGLPITTDPALTRMIRRPAA